jgi:hypothetical protein
MPTVFPGLCAGCAFSRVIDSGRSTFYLCERALTDPRFAKYPPLPVTACPGYQRHPAPGSPADPEADDKLSS